MLGVSVGLVAVLSLAGPSGEPNVAAAATAPAPPPSAGKVAAPPPGAPPPSASAPQGAPPPEAAAPPSSAGPPSAAPSDGAPAPVVAAPAPAPASGALASAEASGDKAAIAQSPIPDEEDEPVYVDYTYTWDEPPPLRKSVVITRHVIRPLPPPPRSKRSPPPPPRARGLVGLSIRGTTTNYNPSAMVGARAGFTFHDRFTIGGALYSLTARYAGAIVDPRGNQLGMRMAYGGVMFNWRLWEGRIMQVGLDTLAGAGAACISRSKKSYGRWNCIEKVGLISIEPGLEIGFKLSDWIRLGVAGGYRFVTREAWREPNDFTLSGPYLGINVDFGWFGDDAR